MDIKELFKRWILLAIGVVIASHTAPGIYYDSTSALVVAVLVLSLFNVVLKPILMVFSLPFIILTAGLGLWFINALLFLSVGKLVEGFHVESFWNALWGAFIVSLTGGIASLLFGSKSGSVRVRVNRNGVRGVEGHRDRSESGRVPQSLKNDEDVIDI